MNEVGTAKILSQRFPRSTGSFIKGSTEICYSFQYKEKTYKKCAYYTPKEYPNTVHTDWLKMGELMQIVNDSRNECDINSWEWCNLDAIKALREFSWAGEGVTKVRFSKRDPWMQSELIPASESSP